MPADDAMITRRCFGSAMLGTGASLLFAPQRVFAMQVRPDPSSRAKDRQILTLGEAALKVKLIGSGSFASLVGLGLMTTAAHQGANLPALDHRDAATFWSQFFRSAQIQVGYAESTSPVVGYYNPFLDYWLLTRWTSANGSNAIAETRFIPNERLSPAPSTAELNPFPAWMTGLEQRSLIQDLRLTCRTASANFQHIFAFQGSSGAKAFASVVEPEDARVVMLARLLIVSRNISRFLHDDGMSDLSGRLCAAMRQERPAGSGLALSPEAKETFGIIAQTPSLVRRNLGVVGALQIQTHWLVVYSSAQSGNAVLVAAIKREGRVIDRLGLINVTAGS